MPRPSNRSKKILQIIDTKKLLHLVQENRLLYDPSHPYYNNVEKREEAWHEIGGNFGPGHKTKLVKMKWNHCWNVYDMFLKNVSKRKATKPKHISYAAEIKFVKPYLEKLRENEKLAKYERYKSKNKLPYVKPTPEQTEVRAKDDSHDKITTTKHEVTNCAVEIEFVKRHRGRPRKNKEITTYEKNEEKENFAPVPTTEQTQIQAQDGNHSEVTKTGYNVNNCALETTFVKRLRGRPRKNKGITNYEKNEKRENLAPVPTTEQTQIQAQDGHHSKITGYNNNNCTLESEFVKPHLKGSREEPAKPVTEQNQNISKNKSHGEITTDCNVKDDALKAEQHHKRLIEEEEEKKKKKKQNMISAKQIAEQNEIIPEEESHSEIISNKIVNSHFRRLEEDKDFADKTEHNKSAVKVTADESQAEDDSDSKVTTTEYKVIICASEEESAELNLGRSKEDEKIAHHEKNETKNDVLYVEATAEQTHIKTEDNNSNYTDDELEETTSTAHSNYTNDVLAETSAVLEKTCTYKTLPLDENDLIFLKYARTKTGYNVNNRALETELVKPHLKRPRENQNDNHGKTERKKKLKEVKEEKKKKKQNMISAKQIAEQNEIIPEEESQSEIILNKIIKPHFKRLGEHKDFANNNTEDNEEDVLPVKVTADESQGEDDSDREITTTEYKVNICVSEKEFSELYIGRSKEDENIAHHEKYERKNDMLNMEATAEQTQIKTEDNNLNYTDDELKETTSSAHSNYTNDVLAETSAILEETCTYKTGSLDENDLIFLKYARTIKKLPTSQQNVLKLKFAKLIMEVETELDGKSTATESVQK